MALFRRLFYRKPPDRLLEISERVYVFDCCFSSEILEENEYKDYLGAIVAQLQDYYPDASFMVFNFREGDKKSHISDILSEYDMTVMDYPRQYEGCPLLPLEMIHHFLKSSESWLSLEGQHNVLLMHCERGGWPVLAFMLAGLLLYRKQYTGEQKTLEMVYKQAPKELLHLFSPLNPQPSHLRYLQYITRQGSGSEWHPKDKSFMLECIILRVVPNFDSKGGCRPVVRVYGQDPLTPTNRSSKVLFSTPQTKRHVRYYRQDESTAAKINARCRVRGDIVVEVIHVDEDFVHKEMILRVMFNTAFIESDVLMLSREDVDVAWNAKDQFPRDFKAEVLFSDSSVAESEMTTEADGDDNNDDEMEGASMEEFFEAQEIFTTSEMHVDCQTLRTKTALDIIGPNSQVHVITDKMVEKLGNDIIWKSSSDADYVSSNKIDEKGTLIETPIVSDEAEGRYATNITEQDVVTEKLITVDDVIAIEEKKMLGSVSLIVETETCPSIDEEVLMSKASNSEPKTIYTSVICGFTPKTITVDDADCKLERQDHTKGECSRLMNIVPEVATENAVFGRTSNLNRGDLKCLVSKETSPWHDSCHNFSSPSASDQVTHMVGTHINCHDANNKASMYTDIRLEVPSTTENDESELKITICDKLIITEKLITLDKMNGTEENKVVATENFIRERSVVTPTSMEQKSTVDVPHLKSVTEGIFTQKIDYVDDANEKPNYQTLGNEDESSVSRSNSKINLDSVSSFDESVTGDKCQNSSSCAVNKIADAIENVDTRRDKSCSASEKSNFPNQKNNEMPLPLMSKKNPTQTRTQCHPVIVKHKNSQQEASSLFAKRANPKIVPRWIYPKKISDATSVYRPSHPPSRYNSAPPALAISSISVDDERSKTLNVPADFDSLNTTVTSKEAPSYVSSTLPKIPSNLSTSSHHMSVSSSQFEPPLLCLQPPATPLMQPPATPLMQPPIFDISLNSTTIHASFSSRSPPPTPPPPPFRPGALPSAPSSVTSYPPTPPPPPPLLNSCTSLDYFQQHLSTSFLQIGNPPIPSSSHITSDVYASSNSPPMPPPPPSLPSMLSSKAPCSSLDSLTLLDTYTHVPPPPPPPPPMLPRSTKICRPFPPLPPPPPSPPHLPINNSSNTSLVPPPPPPPPPPPSMRNSSNASQTSPLPPMRNMSVASSIPLPQIRISSGTSPSLPSSPPPQASNLSSTLPPLQPPFIPLKNSLGTSLPSLFPPMRSSLSASPPPPPPPPPSVRSTPPPPPPPSRGGAPTCPLPPPPPPPTKRGAFTPPSPSAIHVTPSPSQSLVRGPPPPPPPMGSRTPPPPPPPPSVGGKGHTPPPPPPVGHGSFRPPPPPPPVHVSARPPPPPPPGGRGVPPAPPRAPGAPPPPPTGAPNTTSSSKVLPSASIGGRGAGLSRPTGSGSSSLAPRRSSLKPLHWVKVTRAIQGSLWAELQKSEDAPSTSEFDVSELESLFSAVVPKSDDSSKSEGRRKSLGSKSDKVHLIELRRANNTEIMLTKVKMPLPDLMGAVLALDDIVLDVDQVENLIKFCPTKEEMELLKGYTGDKEKLGKCEQVFFGVNEGSTG
ncbi:Formin-like protein 20 [Apostasia shenzhenica]|uniref:Formin-like protein 20 n=1 Tax=Apostasia shenzhenica TaxID=1088818 RepID=A0A2I0AWE2_9ASPA|nr:Formin-like protein 20 [Apostasia shenzhenica]